MNRAELVTSIAEKTGLSKKKAEDALKAFTTTIEETLAKGEEVRLVGFGVFATRERKERVARNPQNPKEEIIVPAHKAPVFKAGKALKESVNA